MVEAGDIGGPTLDSGILQQAQINQCFGAADIWKWQECAGVYPGMVMFRENGM